MQVSVEKTSNLGRRLIIEIPAEQLQKQERQRLKDLSKNLKIKGFQTGVVTPAKESYVKKHYKKQIRSEAVSRSIEESLASVLKEQNLRPANQPSVEDLQDDETTNLKYTVIFDVYPEIVLKDFAAIKLTKPTAEITEADVDSGVQKLQEQFATWAAVSDRAAGKGDKLTIDFVGLLDGTPFEHGSATNFDLELGSGQFIPGFEDGLIGVATGDKLTLDLKFPADYGANNLAGKDVQFEVTVHKIQAKQPAVVDADFAARIGIEDKDPAKVREKIRENMQRYLEDTVNNQLREQVLEQLYLVNPLELPASLVEKQKHSLQHEGKGREVSCETAHGKQLTAEEDAELTTKAQKRIALGLLLNEIIAKHKLQPEQASIMAKLRSMAMMYGGKAEFIGKMYYESKEFRENIENMVLTDQAADLIVAGATIKEEPSTFYGIVNPKSDN